jgi:hypothetical protein
VQAVTEECPVCEAFREVADEGVCLILKQVKPDLDVEKCREVLRSKRDRRDPREVAEELGVRVEDLERAIDESVKIAESAWEEVKKKLGIK